jgi:Flp pilus assembly protein TadD
LALLGSEALLAQGVTFNRDIAPILREQCAGCHRPDGGAPFSLLAFSDARPRAALIASVTRTRTMPPWKPRPGHGTFADARRLSDAQVALIQRWVKDGAIEGRPAAWPTWETAPKGWALGSPDLVLTMPEAYTLPREGPDTIRSFVIPAPDGPGRFVRAVEFHPGNARVVHHANIKIDSSGSSRRLDAEDVPPGFDGSSREARFPDGYFLGWTPGQRAHALPGGAWYLPAGSDIIVELHLTSSGKAELVQSSVGLFLTDVAPSRAPFMIRLGSQRIDIPAGTPAYVSRDRYVLPVEVELLAVQPHAHHLARTMQAHARLPDGRREWLIDIADWDFRWQDVYRYASPIKLPRGTVIEMEYTYDNSSGNPRNPNHPPRRVTFGQTSSAEMGDLWLQVATASTTDRAALDADYAPKMLQEDIAGDETILLTYPRDARLRRDLAECYLAAGRTDEAIAQFEQSLEIEPDSAAVHYELGLVLLRAKQLADAEVHFRRVVDLKPDAYEGYNSLGAVAYVRGATADAVALLERSVRLRDNAEARYNLGRAFAREQRSSEAVTQYHAALLLAPEDAETHAGLAAVLAEQGDARSAVLHYREALRLKPGFVAAIADLAWTLATSTDAGVRQPAEAVQLAEHAARLTNWKNAIVLDTLAVGYFAAGRADAAIRTLSAAVDLAVADADAATAQRLRARRRQYEGAGRR